MPDTLPTEPDRFEVTEINRVRRVHDRGRYDKATIHAFLDAAVVCHIAYTIDGRPYCTPTAFWREGEHLYWHG
jgi:nitroimidazol reductase NimA-like FMN-containing flavoprotein (pyridoxamine 5'-phosphate oxidase superfamily)